MVELLLSLSSCFSQTICWLLIHLVIHSFILHLQRFLVVFGINGSPHNNTYIYASIYYKHTRQFVEIQSFAKHINFYPSFIAFGAFNFRVKSKWITHIPKCSMMTRANEKKNTSATKKQLVNPILHMDRIRTSNHIQAMISSLDKHQHIQSVAAHFLYLWRFCMVSINNKGFMGNFHLNACN